MMKRKAEGAHEGTPRMPLRRRLFICLNILLVLLSLTSAAGLAYVSGQLPALDTAQRFQGESDRRFSAVACYMPVGRGCSEEDIWSFRNTLAAKLVEASMEAPEGGRLTMDAYSGSHDVSLAVGKRTAAVEAIGVGGDFFQFHPLYLRSGSYIREGDLMDDLVLLDEDVAWRLFGSTELSGMEITVNGKPFLVGGVIAREDDFASKRALGEYTGIFMSYSAMKRLFEDVSISCYELVMPDPISGYAKTVVEDTFPVSGGDVVENTHRYAPGRLLSLAGEFGDRSMRKNGVIYPYWENAARLTEDYGALCLFLTIIFALCPAVTLLVLLIRSVIGGYRKVKTEVPQKIGSAVERRRESKYEKSYEENHAEGE